MYHGKWDHRPVPIESGKLTELTYHLQKEHQEVSYLNLFEKEKPYSKVNVYVKSLEQ